MGPIDRGVVVDVMGARDDHRPNARPHQPRQLRGDPLDEPRWLGIRIEQVAGNQEDVDLLAEGEVDSRLERGELALALPRRCVAEVRVARPEMDVRGVQDSEHPVAVGLHGVVAGGERSDGRRWRAGARSGRPGGPRVWCERGAPIALARQTQFRWPL